MAAAVAGDRAAADALLRRHHDRIWAVCRRLAGNDADAADASQEACIAVLRGLRHFDGRARFTTWVHRVATNACLDELRRRGRRPVPGLDVFERAPSGSAAVDESVSDRLTLDDALLALPEEFRVPVVMRDVLGHEYAEIAEQLGVPIGTVRSRIARGRTRLATLIGVDRVVAQPRPGNRPPPADVRPGDAGHDPEPLTPTSEQ